MYEGKIQIPAQMPHGEGTALRAVAWTELTARLDAARELRRELRQDGPFGGASFSDAAAAYFASIDADKPAVNQDALSRGNSSECKNDSADIKPATGDREI